MTKTLGEAYLADARAALAARSDPVYALAAVWASIDGKLEKFAADAPGSDAGYRDGYMTEAEEAIRRLSARGFKIVPIS